MRGPNSMQLIPKYSLCLLLCFLSQVAGFGQGSNRRSPTTPRSGTPDVRRPDPPKSTSPNPNHAKEPIRYAVAYAHLDTEWRWEYPQVIQEYLTKTMRNNFALFEKYPHYIFNFTGANRYRLMKEYYPSDFERLKQYV